MILVIFHREKRQKWLEKNIVDMKDLKKIQNAFA